MTGVYIAVIYSMIIFVFSQLKTPSEYNWIANTVSELAAQKYENRKIMQAGFIGLCVGISGIFCSHPFIKDIPYIKTESKIHLFLS